MIKRTHIVTTQSITMGLILLTQGSSPATLSWSLPFLVGSHYGADFPDIDQAKNETGQKLGVLGKFVRKHTNHRELTHTLWAVLLYVFIGWLAQTYLPVEFRTLSSSLIYGFAWGNLLHMIEDNFSIMGVCFLYPLKGEYLRSKNGGKYKDRKYSKYRYRTNGPFETILYYVMSIVCIILYGLFYFRYFHNL